MKITKNEFINRMATRPHVFMGVTREPVRLECIWETIYNIDIAIMHQDINNPLLIRNTERHSNHLRFSDGSRLYFDDGKYSFYDVSFGAKTIIEVKASMGDVSKYLYYYILD